MSLEPMILVLCWRTGRSRLAVLTVLADRLERLAVSTEDTHEIAQVAAARAEVAAAIDAEIVRGIGR